MDYRITPDAAAIILLSERARSREMGPKPEIGWRLAFRTKQDTADFVRTGEAEGYTFEGREYIADA